MKNNIFKQLLESLEILSDYPNIDNIIDIEKAKDVLNKLSKNVRILNVPDFKEIEPERARVIERSLSTSIDEWLNSLNNLKGVFATTEYRDDPNEVIWGSVDKNLSVMHNSEISTDFDELSFEFLSNDKAFITGQADDDPYLEGTWEDVYKFILDYVQENLSLPEIPKISN